MHSLLSPAELTPSQQKIVRAYSGEEEEAFVSQFLVYAAKGKCIRDCKASSLPMHLRYLDPQTVKDFRQRRPYAYLHFALYQVR